MSAPTVTIVGRLTADPELRFTPSGAAVANFTVASNDSFKKDGEWIDKDPVFMRCTIWRETAESVAESLTRGTEVFVQGKLSQRKFENREGVEQTVIELEVSAIGPVLSKSQTAKVTKQTSSGGSTAKSTSTDDPDW